jgi:SAM-dependent methyltransferase
MANPLVSAKRPAPVFDKRIRILADHLAKTIPAGGTVLDVGCGDGTLDVLLMKLRPDLVCEGAEVFYRPSQFIKVTKYDGATLPFPDKSFDYVTIVDVLHHADDPSRVLCEAARVCRQGVVIKDHLCDGFLAHPTLSLMDWVGNVAYGVRLPYNFLSSAEWQAAFAKAGLGRKHWNERLGLMTPPLSWLFERGLHFVALMTPVNAIA